jgi:hypothetical protein
MDHHGDDSLFDHDDNDNVQTHAKNEMRRELSAFIFSSCIHALRNAQVGPRTTAKPMGGSREE